MPVIRGPRNKLSRREGLDLFGNGGASLERRMGKPPGQQGGRPQRQGQKSEYSIQLREKQKVKIMYCMREKQFQRFFNKAARVKGVTGAELLKLLEKRLDNVIYRLGFARTRMQAQQLINHGHVLVDGHRVDRPSFQVQPDMTIILSRTAMGIPSVQEWLGANPLVPAWLERVPGPGDTIVGRVLREPERTDADAHINETLIVEFYSR